MSVKKIIYRIFVFHLNHNDLEKQQGRINAILFFSQKCIYASKKRLHDLFSKNKRPKSTFFSKLHQSLKSFGGFSSSNKKIIK
jgi:hypothetical protein